MNKQAVTLLDKDKGTMPFSKSRNQKSFEVGDEFQMLSDDISCMSKSSLRVFSSLRWVIKVDL